MKIDLGIERGERQRQFIDYLNAALRQRMTTYSGSAAPDGSGSFHLTAKGLFHYSNVAADLEWRLTSDQNGKLTTLTVEVAGEAQVEGDWERAVWKFVTSVLTNTISERRQKYFHRRFFFYIGQQLDGEYWLPGYRFAPAFAADSGPYLINAERVVSIDQEISAIDNQHAFVLADEAARRHAARLSLLLNTGLYRGTSEHRWVWPVVNGVAAPESVRYPLGFEHPSTRLAAMPQKGEMCSLGQYQGSLTARFLVAGRLLSLPAEARRILRAIDEAAPLVTELFDRCARLYQVAAVCGQQFPSLALAYRVAAVEAFCATDPGAANFKDFMRKYVRSQGNLELLLNYLWGDARSAHFHAGQFPAGEFARDRWAATPFMDAEGVQLQMLHMTCYEVTREAIVNRLMDMLPNPQSTDEAGDPAAGLPDRRIAAAPLPADSKVMMAIRDRFDPWLHPKRCLDDLEWVYRTSFLRFVIRFGAIQFGLLGGGLFLLCNALFSGKSAISLHEIRIAMSLWIPGGALLAAIIWLTAHRHFQKRGSGASP